MHYNLKFVCIQNETYRYLGYDPERTQNWDSVDLLFNQLCQELSSKFIPFGYIKTYDLNVQDQAMTIETPMPWQLESQDLKKHFEDCQKVSLIALTLGTEFDDFLAESLQQDAYTKAVMADAMGSAAAEEAANQLSAIVKELAEAQGFNITSRYSPGYGDLPLDKNQNILVALEENEPTIKTLESFLLSPRKSITALIGWHQEKDRAWVSANCTSNCQICTFYNCPYRKTKNLKDVN